MNKNIARTLAKYLEKKALSDSRTSKVAIGAKPLPKELKKN
ncbi:hypothetical protein [Paenibacillus aquistagni]|uniref:Uncharacterized protein n=1 Tax=Paenibacillus aquistagni TaxID=1852522 RepID=A0A1X7IM91_9BACL|nr:hypothetical protein [Paenibacillus aquistagni]SMG15478.1 hypothetical protein SAMN06295960_0554 [Paenibacillus aquistagni]